MKNKPKRSSIIKFGNGTITPTRGDGSYQIDNRAVEIRRKIEEREESKRQLEEWGIG